MMNKKEALKLIGMIVDGLNPFDENFPRVCIALFPHLI